MSKHMISKWAMCPFYRHEDTQVIYCDGVQEGTVIHLAFSSKTEAKAYKKQYCYKEYDSCIIAQMLSREEEEK